LRIAKYPVLKECLNVCHSYQVSKNIPLSDEMLTEIFLNHFVTYSHGWLNNFKKRYHITLIFFFMSPKMKKLLVKYLLEFSENEKELYN
jgi:hypothetical protein